MTFRAALDQLDLAVFDHLNGGETIEYRSGDGVSLVVSGIFDRSYELAGAGANGVASTAPVVFLDLAGLPSDPSDDAGCEVIVNGDRYEVQEAQPDGMGRVLCLLHTLRE